MIISNVLWRIINLNYDIIFINYNPLSEERKGSLAHQVNDLRGDLANLLHHNRLLG